MRVNLRSTFLLLSIVSTLFVVCLYAESHARSRGDLHAERVWNGVGGACLPFMIIILVYGALGLLDRYRQDQRRG